MSAEPKPGETYLSFDGTGYVEVPSQPAYSVDRTGELTVAAWMRPDVEEFRHQEGTNYVHWIGKGTRSGPRGDQEWACRMYSKTTTDNPPRPQRTSFYVFGPNPTLILLANSSRRLESADPPSQPASSCPGSG